MLKRSLCIILVLLTACSRESIDNPILLTSPSGNIEVKFSLRDKRAYYEVVYRGETLVLPSRLGFEFDGLSSRPLELMSFEHSAVDETWRLPWGEVEHVRDHHQQVRLVLAESGNLQNSLQIVFRAFDDGIGFRYEWPSTNVPRQINISDELTEFVFADDPQSWWIPAYENHRYEYLYQQSPLSQLDVVHTPVTLRFDKNLYVAIHEAALTDFASMTLRRTADTTLKSDLVPWPDGIKVKAQTPHHSPWRTLQIADRPGTLLESPLILNLNEPNKLGDVEWAKPAKYTGIWWAMHLRQNTWSSGPRHGGTTENTKQLIDFAAEHKLDAVLVEGWNHGWEYPRKEQGPNFDFTKAYPDFDITTTVKYGKDKGVNIIGHHETRSAVKNYEHQLNDALDFYQTMGIDRIKTGYVGKRIDGEHWHHGQYMVNHYRKVLVEAAKRKIALNVHEPIKDTGIRRTYPNMMTREGARGQEFNAWSKDGGNPPEHTTILPFTRMLAGPMDFTPGIFDLRFEKARPDNQVNTTLAKQLALYVVLYSPLQMVPDLPENYADNPALQFVLDVPVDWHETRVLAGEIGDYVVIARRDRYSEDWYLGAITDERGRQLSIALDFLESGSRYSAEIYADASDAHWNSNPHPVAINRKSVDSKNVLKIDLAPGGGQAIRFRKNR